MFFICLYFAAEGNKRLGGRKRREVKNVMKFICQIMKTKFAVPVSQLLACTNRCNVFDCVTIIIYLQLRAAFAWLLLTTARAGSQNHIRRMSVV